MRRWRADRILMNSCEGLVAPRLVAATARADNVLLVKPLAPLLRAGGILIAAKQDLDLGATPAPCYMQEAGSGRGCSESVSEV